VPSRPERLQEGVDLRDPLDQPLSPTEQIQQLGRALLFDERALRPAERLEFAEVALLEREEFLQPRPERDAVVLPVLHHSDTSISVPPPGPRPPARGSSDAGGSCTPASASSRPAPWAGAGRSTRFRAGSR